MLLKAAAGRFSRSMTSPLPVLGAISLTLGRWPNHVPPELGERFVVDPPHNPGVLFPGFREKARPERGKAGWIDQAGAASEGIVSLSRPKAVYSSPVSAQSSNWMTPISSNR